MRTIAVVTASKDRDKYEEAFRRALPQGVLVAVESPEVWVDRGTHLNSALTALRASCHWNSLTGVLICDVDCILRHDAIDWAEKQIANGYQATFIGVLEPSKQASLAYLDSPGRYGSEEHKALWSECVTSESALLDATCQYTGIVLLSTGMLDSLANKHLRADLPGLFPSYGTWGGEDTFLLKSIEHEMAGDHVPYARGLARHLWHEPQKGKPQSHGTIGCEEYQAMQKRLREDIEAIYAL